MRYYVMEPLDNILLPAAPKGEDAEIVIVSDLSRFDEIDYDARNGLISDRLKLLMELYMPKYIFEPVVYLEPGKGKQVVFWRFKPPVYTDYQAIYRNDGLLSHILCSNSLPIAFTALSPKGIRSLVVRMALAESALRRCILGVKFVRLLEYKEVQHDYGK